MKHVVHISLTTLVTLLLSGCFGGLDPLTASQKNEVRNFTRSAAKLNSVGKEVRRPKQGRPTRGGKIESTITSLSSRGTGYGEFSKDETYGKVYEQIAKAIEIGNCGDVSAMWATQVNLDKDQTAYKIDGPNCPVQASFDAKIEKENQKFNLTAKLRDAELIKLIDFDEFRVDINVKSDEEAFSVDAMLEMHHTKKGIINIAVNGNGTENEAEVVFRITFPEFVAEFEMKSDKDGTKVKLNGEEITETEFDDYLSGLEKQFNSII